MLDGERKRFMAELHAMPGLVIRRDDVVAEMAKLAKWSARYQPRSIEMAYVRAHQQAIANLVRSVTQKEP